MRSNVGGFEDQTVGDRIWERWPGEPELWFARFDRFRLLGAWRNVNKVFAIEREAGLVKGERATGKWFAMAQRWQWQERAEAWDAHERRRRQVEYEAQRVESQQERIEELRTLRQALYRALHIAQIDQLLQGEARRKLNTLRMSYQAVVAMERSEFGEVSEGAVEVQLSGEDFVAAEREVEQWRAELRGNG